MRRAYAIYALLVFTGYTALAWSGWEATSTQRGIVPAGVRQSGYRSYSFWRGGK
jgi:hypothetical protein